MPRVATTHWCGSFTDLSLAYNGITGSGTALLLKSLMRSAVQTSLISAGSSPAVTGAGAAMALALRPAKSVPHMGPQSRPPKGRGLTHLSLSGNMLGEKGVAAIASALEGNNHLYSLSLDKCGLGPGVGSVLGNALAKNTTLKRLT